MKGIDVSVYQGNINWQEAKNAGNGFALIKSSQGGFTNSKTISPFTDRYFKQNIVGASDAGLMCGTYHYLTGITARDVKAEAEYVVSILEPYRKRITLPVAVDIEDARYRALSPDTNSMLALTFLDTVAQAGYKTMLYTNRDFLRNHYNREMLGDIPIWFALYRNPRSDENVPDDWDNIVFWQWNDNGETEGVVGNVSQDVSVGLFTPDKLEVGSRVRIRENAQYYFKNGPKIPSWVKSDYIHVVTRTEYRGAPVYKNGDECVLLGRKVSVKSGAESTGINTWCAVSELIRTNA